MTDAEAVHVIVTGEGALETILPITKDRLPADRVRIVETDPESTDEYDRYLEDLLGVATSRTAAESFDDQYLEVADTIREELDADNRIWCNATESGYAIATAASTIAAERPAARSRIHAYQATTDGYDQLPLVADPQLSDTEVEVLEALAENQGVGSISQLAHRMVEGDLGDSFRSKVQYNAEKLEDAGYIERVQRGNRMQPRLSPMGRLWVTERGRDD